MDRQAAEGPAYAERVRRVYMDLMRIEVGANFQFVQGSTVLRRVKVKDPTGKDTYVYFRGGQRRGRAETDGVFCLTPDETGLQWPSLVEGTPYNGGPKNADATAWSTYTKLVTPWWLSGTGAGFVLADALPKEVDGTPATQIRVCAEEAQEPDIAAYMSWASRVDLIDTRVLQIKNMPTNQKLSADDLATIAAWVACQRKPETCPAP